jgi:hypothetical protein
MVSRKVRNISIQYFDGKSGWNYQGGRRMQRSIPNGLRQQRAASRRMPQG